MRSARHARHASWTAAVTVGVVLVAAGAGVAWWSMRGGGEETGDLGACRLPVVAAPGAAPGSGDSVRADELRIIERGWTQEDLDPAGPPDGRSDAITMGTVLENTGTRIAYRTRVTFLPLAGRENAVRASERGWLTQEVPAILPGQRVPVGVALHPEQLAGTSVRVTEVRVDAGVSQWLAPGTVVAPFSTVTATVTPERTVRDGQGTASVAYSSDSAWCTELKWRGTSMVFRDRAGKLIGGALDLNGGATKCRPGFSEQAATTNPQAVPSTADLNRTELTEYCDVAPRTGLIPGSVVPSGVPIN